MFAHRARTFDYDADLTAVVSFGVHRCPQCKEPKEFVSMDETQRGPEHAECFECGYMFGTVDTVVIDAVSGRPVLSRRPVLSLSQVREARNRLVREFARSMFHAGAPAAETAASIPNIGQHGPQVSNREALIDSMRRAGASEEQIRNAYVSSDD